MSDALDKMKKKPYVKSLVSGVASVALYYMLFVNEDVINANFAKGKFYALLPIVTAFMFSIAHGTFTGAFWELFGIEAKKQKR
jgi:hypothetical protein